ncbi:MAG: divalent-cation tolerance protein CutA [Thermoguttaceae bacterium]|nr:divalent-cation tolerance protein CutA [Thermoguttaceae bacterium]
MSEFIQILTTTASEGDARKIAGALVEERLAACVQVVGPITSTYRWQGAVERAQEFLCFIKTRAEAYSRVEERIRQLHPYEVPEIVALPITAASAAYLAWIDGEVARQ